MIKRLIEHFACYTVIPIDIKDVGAQIVDAGVKDAINLYPVDIDFNIARGFMHQYSMQGKPYQGELEFADVYYAESMPFHWQQLVQCKEMLHIFDADDGVTRTPDAVARLISEVVAPLEISVWSTPTKFDHACLFWALMILFPKDARDTFKPAFDSGKISAMDIAKIVQIPARYIPFMMADDYDATYARLMAALKA